MSSIPLKAISSARSDADGLAPRTPHSRSGRFDEADLRMPTGTREDVDNDLSDSDPLLRNDAEGPSGPPLQSPAVKPLSAGARFSIIGLTITLFFVFFVGVAYRKSEQVSYDDYVEVQDEYSNVTLISYGNYTHFPLTPKQYRAECRKMGGMKHMAYWTDMKMDVPHHPTPGVCKSTITYMLGSEVGLMGDLALLAQVAALADLVSSRLLAWFSRQI